MAEEVVSRLPESRFRGQCLQRSITLRVLKDGQVIGIVPLGERAYTTIGRNPEMSHVMLDHQSISRRHAVFFFSEDEQTIFVMDLNASHHTYVNATQLTPFEAVKLVEGDGISFGKSTRVYVLETPSRDESVSERQPRPSVPLFAAASSAPVDAPIRDRSEREREIALMTAEMKSAQSQEDKKTTVEGSISLSEMARKFGIDQQADEKSDDQCDDEEEDEDESGVSSGGAEAVTSFAQAHKVPVSHQTDLCGFGKAVTCVSVEPSGNRLAGGSQDFSLKLFDFGGMDSRGAAFRSVVPESGHVVVALAHSPTGDRLLVATSSAQPRVFDREGKEVLKFLRGDMYLRDMANTKGHTMEVVCVAWHPTDKNLVISGSMDGTLRLWDLAGTQTLNQLVNKAVLKIRGAPGAPQGRLAVTACCFSYDGKRIFAGCADGSIQIWAPPVYTRTQSVLRPAFSAGTTVTAVATSTGAAGPAGGVLAARGSDGTLLVWALSALPTGVSSLAQIPAPSPLLCIRGLESDHPGANFDFSPDGALLVAASSARRDGVAQALLSFYRLDGKGGASGDGSAEASPCLQITAQAGASVLCVKWVQATNQILCATSAGTIRVLFDPKVSTKGALLSSGRAPARPKDPFDFATVGQIINPHALPMFRDDTHNHRAKGKKREASGVANQQAPAKAPSAPLVRENASFTFMHMMAQKVRLSNFLSTQNNQHSGGTILTIPLFPYLLISPICYRTGRR